MPSSMVERNAKAMERHEKRAKKLQQHGAGMRMPSRPATCTTEPLA